MYHLGCGCSYIAQYQPFQSTLTNIITHASSAEDSEGLVSRLVAIQCITIELDEDIQFTCSPVVLKNVLSGNHLHLIIIMYVHAVCYVLLSKKLMSVQLTCLLHFCCKCIWT